MGVKIGSLECLAHAHYSRELTTKRRKYEITNGEHRMALKAGQRKLFFNELEFYTRYLPGAGQKVVIYAGSASGLHSYALLQFFPHVHFVFYDPNKFYEKLSELPNLEMHNDYFTLQVARDLREKYKSFERFFLSDIRTGTEEKYVQLDMENQRQWTMALQPRASMLKFRLPWQSGVTEYFEGQIITQPRSGQNSTETRLITESLKLKKYDHDEYNDRMFYHQTVIRNAFHDFKYGGIKFSIREVPGYDHCYDCWSESVIAINYLLLQGTKNLNARLIEFMKKCNDYTFSTLEVAPHGMLPEERDTCKRIKQLHPVAMRALQELKTKQLNIDKQHYQIEKIRKSRQLLHLETYNKLLTFSAPFSNESIYTCPVIKKIDYRPIGDMKFLESFPNCDTDRMNLLSCKYFLNTFNLLSNALESGKNEESGKSGKKTLVIAVDRPGLWIMELFKYNIKIIVYYSGNNLHMAHDDLLIIYKQFDGQNVADYYYLDHYEEKWNLNAMCNYAGRGELFFPPWGMAAKSIVQNHAISLDPQKVHDFHIYLRTAIIGKCCYDCWLEEKIGTVIIKKYDDYEFDIRQVKPHGMLANDPDRINKLWLIANYRDKIFQAD